MMTDVINGAQLVNGAVEDSNGRLSRGDKPFLELYVKASGIDNRRIGACLFCQEFWMELYALYELSAVRVEVKTVNVLSEAFKKNFLGAQPPILCEPDRNGPGQGVTYTDNQEIEHRIFHVAREADVPLFEKDSDTEKTLENLYRNFKVFLKSKLEHDPRKLIDCSRDGEQPHNYPSQSMQSYSRLMEQLGHIDELLKHRKSRYLLGDSMTQYDCELMPRLHHIRIAGEHLAGFHIPRQLIHLWNYIITAYRTAAFIESCPADQDVLHHYKDSLGVIGCGRETLQIPTKTHTIPDDVLSAIKNEGLL